MADTTPNLAFKKLHEGQDEAEVLYNENLNIQDLLHSPVLDRDLSAAPAGVNGNAYIVDTGVAGGDPWENKTDDIAGYYDGWVFITPVNGMMVWVNDEATFVYWNGTAWTVHTP